MKWRTRGFVFLMGLVGSVAVASTDTVQVANHAPRRVVVCTITGVGGYRHSSIPTGERVLQAIAEESRDFTIAEWIRQPDVVVPNAPPPLPGNADAAAIAAHARDETAYREAVTRFEAEAARRLTSLEPAHLVARGIDAVVFENAYLVPLTDAQRTALVDWVATGHGCIAIHAGIGALEGHGGCAEMLAASFDYHRDQVAGELHKRDPDHPATRGLPVVWKIPLEEFYVFKNLTARHDLWGLDQHPNDPKQVGNYPLVWCKTHGKGRVFYTALGHREDVWETPEYARHLREGIAWTLQVGDPSTKTAAVRHEEQLPTPKPISRGGASGTYQAFTYQAFPDVCRLPNGDLLCVFYGGYSHVSLPNQTWPRGGRICFVRSSDEGRTWTEPRLLYDGPLDDRDPHIAALPDGRLFCTFFTYQPQTGAPTRTDTCLVQSRDGGMTWDADPLVVCPGWPSSAPVRHLPDGTLLLGVYGQMREQVIGGVIRSTDQGRTWSPPIPIGLDSGLRLDAETDLIRLQDGTLYAALRNEHGPMQYATSGDNGLTWSTPHSIGFDGHCPHFTRLSTGEILLTHRLPKTELHVSRDEGKSWPDHFTLDDVIGAYPSTVELRDGSVLVVYYTEGKDSLIRVRRFRLRDSAIDWLPL
jgi:type 1 glutamine amidotransferase